MNKKTQILIFKIFLIVMAVFNLAKYGYRVYEDKTDDNPMDFRAFWTATKVQEKGDNFYDNDNVRFMWLNVAMKENLTTESQPGFPVTGITYPPWFPVIFKPFTLFNWGSARIVIMLLNLILLGLIIYLFKQINTSVSILVAVTAVLAFKGTALGLFTGNPLFISLFFIILSLFFYSKNKKIPSGIFLGLASFKISLVFPFVIFFMIKWEWKVLFTSLGVLLLQAAIIMLPYSNPIMLIEGFEHNMQMLWEFGVGNSLSYNVINNTELTTLIGYFTTATKGTLALINYGGLLASLAFIAIINIRYRLNNTMLLSLICVACLMFTHHFIYDGLILIVMLPLFNELPFKQARALAILFIPLILPVTGLAFLLPHDGLKVLLMLHIPFVIMALMITLFIFALQNKKLNGFNTQS